jgi:hypothetical protein
MNCSCEQHFQKLRWVRPCNMLRGAREFSSASGASLPIPLPSFQNACKS